MDKNDRVIKAGLSLCRLNLNTRRDLPIRSSEMGMLIYLVKTDEVKHPMQQPILSVQKAMATNMATSLLIQGIHREKTIENRQARYELIPLAKAVRLVERRPIMTILRPCLSWRQG